MLPGTSPEWRLSLRQVQAGVFEADIPDRTALPMWPKKISLPKDRTAKRKSFMLVVALSEKPVRDTLTSLAIAMSVMSVAILCAAALWSRRLCHSALSPVTTMAEKARLLKQTPDSPGLLDVPPNDDELSELSQAFNQLLITLRDSVDRQQRFAGDASHQLRTPLTAMLTAVDVAARHERSSAEYQRILAVVQRRGRELQQIIEILLALTRRAPGAESLKTELIELNAWCQERMELWQNHPRQCDFDLQFSSAKLLVRLQPALLGQVFDNLLYNACKYSVVGSPISIRTQSQGAKAIISVEDQGHGISDSDLEQIFEPFFRSANARHSGEPGSGLGLTVAHRLATVFAGSLEVESVEGRGSIFRLVLPLAVECQQGSLSPAETPASYDK